jgi:hypothetical protein
LDQSATYSVPNQAGRGVDIELAHEMRAVRFGSLEGNAKRVGDLLGRVALGDELEHLALALTERLF